MCSLCNDIIELHFKSKLIVFENTSNFLYEVLNMNVNRVLRHIHVFVCPNEHLTGRHEAEGTCNSVVPRAHIIDFTREHSQQYTPYSIQHKI